MQLWTQLAAFAALLLYSYCLLPLLRAVPLLVGLLATVPDIASAVIDAAARCGIEATLGCPLLPLYDHITPPPHRRVHLILPIIAAVLDHSHWPAARHRLVRVSASRSHPIYLCRHLVQSQRHPSALHGWLACHLPPLSPPLSLAATPLRPAPPSVPVLTALAVAPVAATLAFYG